MGHNQSPALFTVALLLFAAAAPPAHAEVPKVLKAMTVMGSLCCAPNGHCPDGPPLTGVAVSLVCPAADGGGNVTVGEALTGPNGAYIITVKNLENTAALGAVNAVVGQTLPCRAVVGLPLSQAVCSALSTATGSLAGTTTLVNVVPSKVFGVVWCLVVTVFRLVGLR